MVIGGAKPGPQAKAMQRGADVLVATPGRLLDHMTARAINLTATDTVVLDEADQMMDLGFMPAIRKIMDAANRRQQTLLFSATMPKPIRALASEFLREPAEVAVTPPAKTADRVDQSVYFIKTAAKQGLLNDLIADDGVERAIVFTRTKHGADKVVRGLAEAGTDAEAIHGNKSQGQRVRALENFKSGKVRVLVATDIAARGLDIDAVSHVFNFDMPNLPESYVHRIGRTARAGKSGLAISFVGNDERAYLRDIEKLTRVELKRLKPPEGTELDLSRKEDPGPHTMQSRGQGGRGQQRPQGQRARTDAPRAQKSGGGKPLHRGGKPKSGQAQGSKPGGHRKGKVKAWSPV
jgi:ATP-dependent RNA helicase RhlE